MGIVFLCVFLHFSYFNLVVYRLGTISSSVQEQFFPPENSSEFNHYHFASGTLFLQTVDYFYGGDSKPDLSKVTYGEVVYVSPENWEAFMKGPLQDIQHPFVLVTGLKTHSVPSELYGKNRQLSAEQEADIRTLLESSRLLHWYTQNYDATIKHDKLSVLPLGVDYHTMSNTRIPEIHWGNWQPRHEWGVSQSLSDQDQQLADVALLALPVVKRLSQVYYDAHLNETSSRWSQHALRPAFKVDTLSRVALGEKFRTDDNVVSQSSKMPRIDQWRERTRYAFALSPIGEGLDCHRTWESLALGQIVIVQSGPLDSLYEGLPVVKVDDWDEITRENLDIWLLQYGDPSLQPLYQKRMSFRYWYEKIHGFKGGSIFSYGYWYKKGYGLMKMLDWV